MGLCGPERRPGAPTRTWRMALCRHSRRTSNWAMLRLYTPARLGGTLASSARPVDERRGHWMMRGGRYCIDTVPKFAQNGNERVAIHTSALHSSVGLPHLSTAGRASTCTVALHSIHCSIIPRERSSYLHRSVCTTSRAALLFASRLRWAAHGRHLSTSSRVSSITWAVGATAPPPTARRSDHCTCPQRAPCSRRSC